ncbi:MAG: hypothetical protein RLZZ316_1024 [Bacteroidota bacterium]|jgi:uncharacterized membrane protein SpoIIM required for sporulation
MQQCVNFKQFFLRWLPTVVFHGGSRCVAHLCHTKHINILVLPRFSAGTTAHYAMLSRALLLNGTITGASFYGLPLPYSFSYYIRYLRTYSMREAQFLKQNKDRWQQYERVPTNNPDELAERFVQLTDDLAYAKTFYPKSKTVLYLNGLASKFHLAIYKNRKEKSNRVVSFFITELPLLLHRYRKDLLYAFLFFTVFFLIGWLSAANDETFVRLILGDGYVNMTNENIEKGDPFGVYKQEDPMMMFLAIALNNIKVSIYVYVLGIFAGVYTVYLLFRNGIMLGSFMHYFFAKGLGMQAVMVVFIHGTIEIAAIIFAGAAGLILGKSWMFPGTYTRIQGLIRGAKDSVKIVLGLIPFFLIAAFFEGFVTRHTEMPLWLSGAILAGSLLFILWYFVWYPRKVHSKVMDAVSDSQTLRVE